MYYYNTNSSNSDVKLNEDTIFVTAAFGSIITLKKIRLLFEEWRESEAILYAFSSIGVVLSFIGLTILLITLFTFPQWRKKYQNQLLVHFNIAKFSYSLLMILTKDLYYPGLILRRVNTEERVVAALKFYLTLVLMLWTLLFTKHLYDSLVVVMSVKSKHKLLKESIFAWLTPLPVASVLLGLSLVGFSTAKTNFWCSMMINLPIAAINTILYCRVAYSVLTQVDRHSARNKSRIRTVTVFVIMFIVLTTQDALTNINLMLLATAERIKDTHKINIVLKTNYTLLGVSHYQCFVSIVYWLWGYEKGRKMWRLYAREKFEGCCCKMFSGPRRVANRFSFYKR